MSFFKKFNNLLFKIERFFIKKPTNTQNIFYKKEENLDDCENIKKQFLSGDLIIHNTHSEKYKEFLQNYFTNCGLDFWNFKLLTISNLMKKLMKLKDRKKQDEFLLNLCNLNFLSCQESESELSIKNDEFFIFEDSKKQYNKIINNNKMIFLHFVYETRINMRMPIYFLFFLKVENGIVTKKDCLSFDPKDISSNKNLPAMIEFIYGETHEDTSYIVFSMPTFLNAIEKIKEKLLKEKIKNNELLEKIKHFSSKKNLFDFSQFFKYDTQPMILFRELCGNSEINDIVKIIPEHIKQKQDFMFFEKLNGCQNDKQASELIKKRHEGENITSEEWDETTENIIQWGKNYVDAMYAGFLYISEIMQQDLYFYSLKEFKKRKKIIEEI